MLFPVYHILLCATVEGVQGLWAHSAVVKKCKFHEHVREVFGAQWTTAEVIPTHFGVHILHPHGEESQLEPTHHKRAWVQLWAMRKQGSSPRTMLYSDPLTAIKAPRAVILEQRHALSPPIASYVVDHKDNGYV